MRWPFRSPRLEPPPDGRQLYVWVRPMRLRDGRERPDNWRRTDGRFWVHVPRHPTPSYAWLDEGVVVLAVPAGAVRAGVTWTTRLGRSEVHDSVPLGDAPFQLLHYVYDGQAITAGPGRRGRIAVEAIDASDAASLGAVTAERWWLVSPGRRRRAEPRRQ